MTTAELLREAEKLLPCMWKADARSTGCHHDQHIVGCPARHVEPVAQALAALMVELDDAKREIAMVVESREKVLAFHKRRADAEWNKAMEAAVEQCAKMDNCSASYIVEHIRALRRPDAPANTEMPGEDGRSDVDDDSAWIIWFEDPEKSLQMFSRNGATNAAYRVYEMLRQSWSCHLFKRIHGEGDKPLPATPMHVEQLRAKVVATSIPFVQRGGIKLVGVRDHIWEEFQAAVQDLQTKERDLG